MEQENSKLCLICRNYHNEACSSEITYFYWSPDTQKNIPQKVEIVGSWYEWQYYQRMEREVDQKGEVYFQIGISIPVGYFQYKYTIDEKWAYNQYSPITPNPYGEFNNYIEVLPKTAILESNLHQNIKISSNITKKGLKIVGSWDNWKSQTKMQRVYNTLKGSEQSIIYLQLIPNTLYEFKLKLNNQYFIDQNYPTIPNKLGGLNNRIYVKDASNTSVDCGTRSTSNSGSYTCKSFQWDKITVDSDVSFHRQQLEGHSLCQIGEQLYIFGGRIFDIIGRLKHDFTNRLSKLSIHRLNSITAEQMMPTQRAYHNCVVYGNKMIVYGGHNKQILQDYSVFNTNSQQWQTSPIITGKVPQKKQKQSCVLYETFLVFFGGYYCSSDLQFQFTFNDIQVLDIKPMKWIDEKSINIQGAKPKKRYSHSAELIRSNMYIFGGAQISTDSIQPKYYNDLWRLNLQTVSNLKWHELKPKGKSPIPRQGHSCNSIKQFLIIFGGLTYGQQLLNDVVIYQKEHNQWIYPQIKNSHLEPAPRAFHAATTVNNQYIVLFGGKNNNYHISSMYVLKPKQLVDMEEYFKEEQTIETDLSNTNIILRRKKMSMNYKGL